jgi:hypothetical protein
MGSLAELDTHFEIVERLRFVDAETLGGVKERVIREGQLLHGLLRSLAERRA